MRWAGHVANMGALKNLVDDLKGDYLKHLCVIFRGYKGREGNGFIWIRIKATGGVFINTVMNFRFLISRLIERLVASLFRTVSMLSSVQVFLFQPQK
jgi:hypothetical protein